MSAEHDHDLPPSAFEGVSPPSRELALWRDDMRAERFELLASRLKRYLPHGLIAAVVIAGGFAVSSYATAPALTDGVDELAAIDARRMGLAANLDASGAEKRSASLTRDVGSLKSEIARLQKALGQSKAAQNVLSKSTAGQAAANQDEVRGLKAEIASLTKTLDATRDAAAAKIDALQAKVDEPKQDDPRVAELRDRLDKLEKSTAARKDASPETTGSVAPKSPASQIVRNWTVREVNDNVAVLEGRHGTIEVEPGARAPGIGRIRSIERRDGEWVVVTDRGVILQR